jgi:autophagy-related protein 101
MFDLSYATCGDPAVDAAVEARLDALQAWLRRETRAGGETHARVTLSFHELQHVGGTQRIEKRPTACWEQWRVPLEVVVVDEAHAREEVREQLALELRDTLRGAIQHVLGLAGERKDHIPPVTTASAVCFPFAIGGSFAEDKEESRNGALGTLKKMLVDASPPSMLG